MRDFKFFNKNKELQFSSNFFTVRPQTIFENVEYCFQFDGDEPVPFAFDTNEISIKVSANSDGHNVLIGRGGMAAATAGVAQVFASPVASVVGKSSA